MQKGHMRQTKQGGGSTKLKELVDEILPVPEQPIPRERNIMVRILEMQELIATDQMGKFPYMSSMGPKVYYGHGRNRWQCNYSCDNEK